LNANGLELYLNANRLGILNANGLEIRMPIDWKLKCQSIGNFTREEQGMTFPIPTIYWHYDSQKSDF